MKGLGYQSEVTDHGYSSVTSNICALIHLLMVKSRAVTFGYADMHLLCKGLKEN